MSYFSNKKILAIYFTVLDRFCLDKAEESIYGHNLLEFQQWTLHFNSAVCMTLDFI